MEKERTSHYIVSTRNPILANKYWDIFVSVFGRWAFTHWAYERRFTSHDGTQEDRTYWTFEATGNDGDIEKVRERIHRVNNSPYFLLGGVD